VTVAQVGGDHYHNDRGFAHWDLIVKLGHVGYFDGQATKYVVRWREKGGAEDLKKSLSYLNKLEESGPVPIWRLPYPRIVEEVARFNEVNGVPVVEAAFIAKLCTWQSKAELAEARQLLFSLLDEVEGRSPVPVPLTEENHYAERQRDGW